MESAVKRVGDMADALNEHFESVLIIVTENIDGATTRYSSDRGNCYASSGAVQEWLDCVKAENDIRVRRNSD